MTPDLAVRCFCRTRPLLAKCGRDANGEPFVHVRVWKQGRVFGEMIANAGTVRLKCRECGRWHAVDIKRVEARQEPLPGSLAAIDE